MLFKISFLIFAILAMFYRMWDSFLNNKECEGKIFFFWTLPAIFIISWGIFLGTLLELFIIDRKINYILSIVSLIIFTSALFCRSLAKKQLSGFYSNHIKIINNHKIVKSGFYKWIRHPYYLFFILEVLFFPLMANAYFTFVIGLVLFLPLIIYRSRQEDGILEKYIGKEFINYKRITNGFLPFKNIFNL